MTTVITPDGTHVEVDVNVKVSTPPASYSDTQSHVSILEPSDVNPSEMLLSILHGMAPFIFFMLALAVAMFAFNRIWDMFKYSVSDSPSSSASSYTTTTKKELDFIDTEIERIKAKSSNTTRRSGSITRYNSSLDSAYAGSTLPADWSSSDSCSNSDTGSGSDSGSSCSSD